MFADALLFTHNGTGGNGTLTLAAISGFPMPSNVPNWPGTVMVDYEIAEYTDNTYVTPKNYERGYGSLVISTNVLTRSRVDITWDGAAYKNQGATALNFGNTAANIRGSLTASAATQRPALPATNSSNDGYVQLNTRQLLDSNDAGVALVAGTKYYIPVEFAYAKPISTIGIDYRNTGVTGNIRISLYDWGTDGLPGNLLTEFTASSQIACNTATGIKSITPATPFWIPPGWYWAMVQADAAFQILEARAYGNCGAGSSGQRSVVFASKTGTYGAAPNPADTGLSFTTQSGGDQWALYIK